METIDNKDFQKSLWNKFKHSFILDDTVIDKEFFELEDYQIKEFTRLIQETLRETEKL